MKRLCWVFGLCVTASLTGCCCGQCGYPAYPPTTYTPPATVAPYTAPPSMGVPSTTVSPPATAPLTPPPPSGS